MQFDRLRRNWENLGQKDPMWAVLTKPGTEGGKWNEAEFYATGTEFVAWLGSWLGLHQIEIQKGAALDFGCGAGRLTFALQPHFERVTGVDISASMIEFASKRNTNGERVQFVCNAREDLSLFADGSFAFVLSAIVLQHMRADYALCYVAEFLRVLQPGGLLFFQMATGELQQVNRNAPEQEPEHEAHMEIHCASLQQIHEVIATAGGELLREEQNRWAGEHWQSYHFAVRKR